MQRQVISFLDPATCLSFCFVNSTALKRLNSFYFKNSDELEKIPFKRRLAEECIRFGHFSLLHDLTRGNFDPLFAQDFKSIIDFPHFQSLDMFYYLLKRSLNIFNDSKCQQVTKVIQFGFARFIAERMPENELRELL